MAAPEGKTIKNLSGKWVVETRMSEGFDPLLALQGLAWWKRQAVFIVTLTESVKQYVDEKQVTHIDIQQKITGGFKGGDENRVVDGEQRHHDTEIFGKISEWSRWTDLSDVDDEYLKEGWVYPQGDNERGGPKGEKHLEVSAINEKNGFTTIAVWGFVELGGKRYHARKVVCKKGDQVARATGIYGWRGNA